jgi:hypothetical protein
MSQKDLVQASLRLADTPEDRHGVYPKRPEPPRVELPIVLLNPGEDPDFPGCYW